jgi:hypothetical protein
MTDDLDADPRPMGPVPEAPMWIGSSWLSPKQRGLDPACQTKRAPLADRGDDLYETPPIAVRALLAVEQLPDAVWEPACGPGAIVSVLREAGHRVYATDLNDHGCPDSESGVDFLMERAPASLVGAILTNPPYKLATEFVAHALTLCPRVVMLLRLAFLESERRRSILEGGHLARVHVFRKRLPMMHRHGWSGRRASSAIPYAWFVWDRKHRGPTQLNRISWEPE